MINFEDILFSLFVFSVSFAAGLSISWLFDIAVKGKWGIGL